MHGARWLLGRWQALAARLETARVWTDAQRNLALDLLGTPPEFRDAHTPIDFPGLAPEAAHLALARFVSDRMRELQDEIDRHLTPLDDGDRRMRLDDLALLADADLARLHRYERTLANRVLRVLDTLRGLGATVDETNPSAEGELPRVPSVTVECKTGSAMVARPSLAPPVPEPAAPQPASVADWLGARTDDEIEKELLPLVIARVERIHRRLTSEFGPIDPQG